MAQTSVRLYYRQSDGTLEDAQQEFDLSSFAGVLPAAGDLILDSGVLQGLDRSDPANRRLWCVVGRVFNPRDLEDYVALVVEERPPHPNEYAVMAG
jgi:hypothetical protein